ncbi:hypothetical protein L226DRAFT_16924 [Lentinus tigrinus ALCF2SS1-7]|uniref:uncharacterized protein n=1 Tax=Lentinus tigrinus ALCF2SS1-7 TaxID=1328758 RepID=UPI0011661A72|nr:hypothetical protein L226DRAFT_16924 [Lentinus tigrinus ALCF2SS1-7]
MAEFSISILTFPPEIRALILANAVIFTKTLVRIINGGEGQSVAPQLSLLLANKTVYEEAAALFYELNTFRFILPSQGRDSYFDKRMPIETKCVRALTVPTQYINRLRHVVFYKPLQGYWPNGPLTDTALGPEGLGEKELALMLDTIATHSGILTSISVQLQRQSTVTHVQWDTDPLVMLKELDRGQRFSSIVERLPQLQRLEIWKGRKCLVYYMAGMNMFPEGRVERGEKYAKPVEEAKLKQVREEHFRGVKSARYERRAWGRYVETQNSTHDLFMAEGFVLNFTDRVQ